MNWGQVKCECMDYEEGTGRNPHLIHVLSTWISTISTVDTRCFMCGRGLSIYGSYGVVDKIGRQNMGVELATDGPISAIFCVWSDWFF